MSRSLVIVESPTKARTISKFLGRDFDVRSSMGHVRDLPSRDLGVDIESGFLPEYTILDGKEKIVKELRQLGSKADMVYLATDPDREGEAIAWHVAEIMNLPIDKARRITFHEITRTAIHHALEQPGTIDMKKVDAQQARRVLDRIVGYQVSPLLWKTVRRGLSAGRVQSVALRMICEREDEIDAFVPEEYWTVCVLLANGEISFEADLSKVDGRKPKIGDEATAKEIKDAIAATKFDVASIEKKRQKRRPSPPFITSTLQQEASRKLGMPAAITMRVAQQLYEGIEVGGEQTGLITYMRTDSTNIANEALDAARSFIDGQFGAEYLPKRPNRYRNARGAQEAHEAIRPTLLDHPPQTLKETLTRDQFRLYRLIWNRFIASQMNPQELDITTVKMSGGRFELQTSASVVAFDGFTRVYLEGRDDEEEEVEHTIPLALLEAWDAATEKGTVKKEPRLLGYNPDKVVPDQHFTKPPARFSEATLIKELESEGIGRPSTYAQIISTILDRNYVDKNQGRLSPTDLGRVVNRILVSQFPNLFNVEFTARMEDELDKVEQGNDHWKEMLGEFYGQFEKALSAAMDKRKELKESTLEKSDEVCEKCGRPMVIRFGPRGKFLSCSGFPECKNAKPIEEEGSGEPYPGVECPVCGGQMRMRNGRFGDFLACMNYPECKGTMPIPTGVACPNPECEGHLVVKTSRRGKRFYGCDQYPKCETTYWDKPVPLSEPDPESGLLFKLEKVKRDGTTEYRSAQYPPPQRSREKSDDSSTTKKKKPAAKKRARRKTST